MIVFGDVHIGSPHAKIQELRRCLKALNTDEVAITGDLFDDQHRLVGYDDAARLIKKAMEILQIKPRRLYISFSSSSHDPQLPGPLVARIDGVEVYADNGNVLIEDVVKAALTHGDAAVKNGFAAYLIDLARRGQVGRWLRKKLALEDGVWLIYGHSHVPYLNAEEKILNPGSWKIYGVRRLRGNVYQLPSPKPLCQPDL
ncbi:phosphohydrolase [Pyrobaculum neutrophilum]|uniref:Calcineurin-like phosphoesterase domain-containing protein n=1 Tax=Pyrobaculum neutrophilum (strain DSM 2338 / JCM 9278 / NBRC 100436 / V24Sta) TaxID=444157 RepID=B1Y9X7_PYRNV|nr:phosphohydrolase [Pyrobaculum neutrophilum]ACB40527.1 conserved hypothetical protein [Pyrobaculum neutrophilum V24Sta]